MTPDHHIAQINIGRLVAPLDDPKIAGFVAQLSPINKLADESPGFVWRLQSEKGNATDIVFCDDPFMIVNMSVWESLEALKQFTYRSRHVGVLKDAKQWFETMTQPHYCLWWVPIGHVPTVAEGRDRLERYQRYGPSAEAFWFQDRYQPPSAALVS